MEVLTYECVADVAAAGTAGLCHVGSFTEEAWASETAATDVVYIAILSIRYFFCSDAAGSIQ